MASCSRRMASFFIQLYVLALMTTTALALNANTTGLTPDCERCSDIDFLEISPQPAGCERYLPCAQSLCSPTLLCDTWSSIFFFMEACDLDQDSCKRVGCYLGCSASQVADITGICQCYLSSTWDKLLSTCQNTAASFCNNLEPPDAGPVCGNEHIDNGEECDEGEDNSDSPDASCRANCMLPRCGDGIVDTEEECDLGQANSDQPDGQCRTNCRARACGDGIPDQKNGEECDEGKNNSDEPNASCRSNCLIARCGDGIVDVNAGEECEQADQPVEQNTCRHDCTLIRCGDSKQDVGEECDLGSRNSQAPGAPCRTNCMLPKCGDGIVDNNIGEQCDEGKENSNRPNASCRLDCKSRRCGDGVVDAGEECDEGRNNSDEPNASCRSNCLIARCGDGIVDSEKGEECDDPRTCSTKCKRPRAKLCLETEVTCPDGLCATDETNCATCKLVSGTAAGTRCWDNSCVPRGTRCSVQPPVFVVPENKLLDVASDEALSVDIAGLDADSNRQEVGRVIVPAGAFGDQSLKLEVAGAETDSFRDLLEVEFVKMLVSSILVIELKDNNDNYVDAVAFIEPVIIELAVTLPAGTPLSEVCVAFLDEAKKVWECLPTINQTTSGNLPTIAAETTHFTHFAAILGSSKGEETEEEGDDKMTILIAASVGGVVLAAFVVVLIIFVVVAVRRIRAQKSLKGSLTINFDATDYRPSTS